jgi:hypothetical protein
MYLTRTKAMIVTALKTVFDAEYPNENLRDLWISIEYPVKQQNYPGIWVGYQDAAPLQIAGISHVEYDDEMRPYTRWRFQGNVTFTIVAFTSLERDTIYDELIRVIAFGHQDQTTAQFRTYVETNEYIAANFDLDRIEAQGETAAPGTPWGSDDVTYERSCSLQMLGEFVVEPTTGAPLLLSKIVSTAYTDEEQTDEDFRVTTVKNYEPGDWI